MCSNGLVYLTKFIKTTCQWEEYGSFQLRQEKIVKAVMNGQHQLLYLSQKGQGDWSYYLSIDKIKQGD